jgi:hypothetical protein
MVEPSRLRRGRRASWLTTDFALAMFAPIRARAHAAYCKFVDATSVSTLDESLLGTAAVLGTEQFVASIKSPSLGRQESKESLADLAAQACAKFGIAPPLLVSTARTPLIIAARAWITRHALERGIANLSAIARFLGRERATLRHAMRQYGEPA